MALLFLESFDGYGGTNTHMTRWSLQPTLSTTPAVRTGTHIGRGTGVRVITPEVAR